MATVLLAATVGGLGAAAVGLLTAASTPDNDEFVQATTVDQRVTGTTAGALADADEVAAGVATADQRVVWYSWPASVSGWAHLVPASVDNPTMPEVQVYRGDRLDALVPVELPPAAPGAGHGLSIPAVAGQDYRLAVVSGPDGVAFDLALVQPSAMGAVNDQPDGAIDVGATVALATETGTPHDITIETLGDATADPGEAPTHGQPAERSLWYTWTPTVTGGAMTFAAQPVYGSPGPIRVAVYTAGEPDEETGLGVGDLTPAPGGDTGGPVTVEAGTTYLISVDGPDAFFRLQVTSTGVQALVDDAPPVVACTPPSSSWHSTDQITVDCTASDDDSGLAQPADAAFTVALDVAPDTESETVVVPARTVCDVAGNCTAVGPWTGLRADRKPPTVQCGDVDPAWSPATPTVTCTASDDGSGLADPADATRVLTATVAPDTEDQVAIDPIAVCDIAGNCTTVGPFGPTGVDTKAPVVTCAPGPTGPTSAQVEVACTALDEGSGLADPGNESFTLTTSVQAGEAVDDASTDQREVCDVVGNCATAGPFGGFTVDLAPPEVTCRADDGASLDAWRAGPFTITCTLADVGTGLAPGTPTSVQLEATAAEGTTSTTVTATSALPEACDQAGSCTPIGPIEGLRIDRQAPTVTCPTAGDGWSSARTEVACTIDDGDGSGVAGAATVVLRAEAPTGQEGTYATGAAPVCDVAGNCITAGPVPGLRIDHRPPDVDCSTPAARYLVEARIRCTAADGGSGLADGSDASFVLTTSVGAGRADGAARTSTREVCDVAGQCTTVGPFTVSVDLTGPGGDGPGLDLPRRISVLAAYPQAGPTAVPYALPTVPGADEVDCRARPGSTFGVGWSRVVCEAIDPTGTSRGSFPLVVKTVPSLAPHTTAIPGGAWRAVGVGYAPGTTVVSEVGGQPVAQGTAGPDGRAAVDLVLPAQLPSGDHRLVLRGVDPTGDPMLNISPLAAVAAPAGQEPPTTPPDGAPELPADGPDVPPDPGTPPAAPDLGDLPPVVTTPTTTPGGPTTSTSISLPGGDGSGDDGDGGSAAPDPGSGSGSAPGAGGDRPGGSGGGVFGRLPRTGGDVAAWALLGGVLIGAGLGFRRLRRSVR